MAGEEQDWGCGGGSHEGERPAKNEVTTVEGSAKTPAIRLVLNGGGTTMDSATVPVEWFFSKELLAKKPQYVVLCDHEFSLEKMRERNGYDRGYRYLVAVKDLVKYVQLFRPGRHHLACIVFSGDRAEAFKEATSYLRRDRNNDYSWTIWNHEIVNGQLSMHGSHADVAAVEFEVPEALFAPRSDSKAAKAVWKWVNLLFTRDPRDQCAYRKRMIFAFTLQPILAFVVWFVFGILRTLYTLAGAALLSFLGFRPARIASNLVNAWTWRGEFSFNILKWDDWRRWDNGKGLKQKFLPVWCVPMVLCFGSFTLLFTGSIAMRYPREFVFVVATLAALAAVVLLVSLAFRRVRTALANADSSAEKWARDVMARAEERARVREEQRFARLYESLSLEANTGVTHVDVPVVAKRVESNVTRFKLSFWAAKAQVCKPFAK